MILVMAVGVGIGLAYYGIQLNVENAKASVLLQGAPQTSALI